MELTMFEKILQLPLFQGLTTNEISEVLSHIRLDFVNYQAGDEFVIQGDVCKGLIYIINGEIASEYRDSQGRFTFSEKLPQTGVIDFATWYRISQIYVGVTRIAELV